MHKKLFSKFKKPEKGTVKVIFTNGVGNNIFQYVYARLLADHYGLNLSCKGLEVVKVPKATFRLKKDIKTIKIGPKEKKFHKYFEISEPCNFIVHTHPEDYTIYKPHLKKIRSWFNDIPKTNTSDLVLHLRLGDRLLEKFSYHPLMKVQAEEFISAFQYFDFKRLHIVTDMKVWKKITPKEVKKMDFHTKVKKRKRIDPVIAADYFNSLHSAFEKFNPVVRAGKNIKDDFNYIRSFDKILFQHGTLAWWAATLSHASKVGVFEPWRPIKKENNRNLGQTNFDGWFGWGKNRDTIKFNQ